MSATTERLYALLKPNGQVSGANSYSAISRLQGHLGGTIILVPSEEERQVLRPFDKQGDVEPFDVAADWEELA